MAWRTRPRRTASQAGTRILFYHRISEDADSLAVRPSRFRDQMAWLASEGYRVVDLEQAQAVLASGHLTERVVALTFDDGYSDVAENALPVLEKHGFRASVFVVPCAVDGTSTFSWYERTPPLMSWQDITALDRGRVFRFDAHTMTHPNLLQTEPQEAVWEIRGSKESLEQRLERSVSAFCYPAGLFRARERQIVVDAGYAMAVSCEPGVNGPQTDVFALRRTAVERSDRLLDFRAKVGGAHDSPLPLRAAYRRVRYPVPETPS